MHAKIKMKDYKEKVVNSNLPPLRRFNHAIPDIINKNSDKQCFQLKSRDIDLL